MRQKLWYSVYGNVYGKKTVLAKVRSKGFAYLVMQRLSELYDKVGIE
jgi:hypothetical protein